MRYLFIVREQSLAKEIRRLDKAGWVSTEMLGAMHCGSGVRTIPLELTRK